MLTNNEKNEIGRIYAATCKSFDKILDPDVLKLQIEDLADLEFSQISAALTKYRTDPKNNFWPRASKIRELIFPKQSIETLSNEAASRIRQAISEHGWSNPVGAKIFIGELGWKIVQRSGGWQYLCENHGVELSPLTFHAQARDLAKAMLESESLNLTDEPIMLSQSNKKTEISSMINLLSEKRMMPNDT